MIIRYINPNVIFSLILLGCPSLQGMQQLAKHAAHTVSHINMQKGASRMVQIAPAHPPITYQAPVLALQYFMQRQASLGMRQNVKATPALPAYGSSSTLICRQEISSHASSHSALPLFHRLILRQNMSHQAAAFQKVSASGVIKSYDVAQARVDFEHLINEFNDFSDELKRANFDEYAMDRRVQHLVKCCRTRICKFAREHSIDYKDESGKTLLHHVHLMQKAFSLEGLDQNTRNHIRNFHYALLHIVLEFTIDTAIQPSCDKMPINYQINKDAIVDCKNMSDMAALSFLLGGCFFFLCTILMEERSPSQDKSGKI